MNCQWRCKHYRHLNLHLSCNRPGHHGEWLNLKPPVSVGSVMCWRSSPSTLWCYFPIFSFVFLFLLFMVLLFHTRLINIFGGFNMFLNILWLLFHYIKIVFNNSDSNAVKFSLMFLVILVYSVNEYIISLIALRLRALYYFIKACVLAAVANKAVIINIKKKLHCRYTLQQRANHCSIALMALHNGWYIMNNNSCTVYKIIIHNS